MPKRSFYDEYITALKAGTTYSLTENLPDPDPILRKVGADIDIYREIRSDTKVNACIEQRKAGTLSLMWGLLPSGADGSEKAAGIIEETLRRMDMPSVLSDMLEAFLWGFQPLEIMWELRDGLILPKSVKGKPPEWFVFDYGGNLKFRSRNNPMGEALPERKFLLTQHHPSYRNPYGLKTLPMCFWPVTFKKGGLRWWVTLAEKWGQPMLIAKYPRGLEPHDQDSLLEMLDALYQDAVGIMPNDTQLETISPGNSDPGSVHKSLIDQCNAEIALAIVGQTLSSEVGTSGSYAAAQSHLAVRKEIIDYDKRMCERACQQLVDWIYELNWPEGQPPVFSLWKEADIDKDLAERDKILTDIGVRFNKEYFHSAYGLKDEFFDMAAAPEAATADFAEAEPARRGAGKPSYQRIDPGMLELDGKKLSEIGRRLAGDVVRLLDSGLGYEEIQERLLSLYPGIDDSELQDFLARAMFAQRVEGRLGR